MTGQYLSNLERLVDEGRRQSVMEDYQAKNKVIVLNSKLDFIQPMRTQLTTITKSTNSAPGRKDNINYNPPLLQAGQMTDTRPKRRIVKGRRRLPPFQPLQSSTPEKKIEI